ncbi:hypothetical protein JVT61DRAFT_4293 [Boletus reticuloceps]|uniref:Uncharacterized protein n=1 Tax=Boletus reticuloceps TaxID=495285 RepID=A0A8I2YND5_9AGAM|nr:hypothetical protein JVT61DRAFT_4293 [Boletus reticuloceps]
MPTKSGLTQTIHPHSNMDLILEESLKNKCKIFLLQIPDVDDIGATLYVLNSGTMPPMPLVGDFTYNFVHGTSKVYHPNGWWMFMVADVESLLRHPNVNSLIIAFTASGIPFWRKTSRGQVTQRCNFSTIDALLSHFRWTFNSSKLDVMAVPPSTNTEWQSNSHSESLAASNVR